MFNFIVDGVLNHLAVNTELLEDIVGNIFAFFHYSGEDVYWFNGLLAIALCDVDRTLNSFLSFNCKFVECHSFIFPFCQSNVKKYARQDVSDILSGIAD